MGGSREVSIISHRPVISNDLKQERSFYRGSVSTFLQLVVAFFPFKSCRIEALGKGGGGWGEGHKSKPNKQ